MNNLQVTLTKSTIEAFMRKELGKIEFSNQEEPLYDNHGVKIVTNVHVKEVQFSEFALSQPDIFTINKISVEFEKLNVVVNVDIPTFEDRNVIVTQDIPPVSYEGHVVIPGREVPDIVLWDLKLFEDNPDIKLTLGLENLLKPNFSVSFKINTNDFNVKISLKDFQINDFVVPDSIAEEIRNNIIDEIKKKINVENKFLEEILGKIIKSLPIPDFSGLIIDNVVKSKQFEDFVAGQIQSKLEEYTLLVPSNFKLGTNDSPIELSINSPTVNVTENTVQISIDVNEL